MHLLKRPGVLVVLGIGIGSLSGYGIANVHAQSQLASVVESFHPLRLPESDASSLVHPLFAYDTPEAMHKPYSGLRELLQKSVTEEEAGSSVKDVSVYYRDLDTGSWIGINPNNYYYPASLLKVPVMIAFFKEAELRPGTLDKRITYRTIAGDPFETKSALTPGRSYSVRELIETMIVDSDNGATYTLLDAIDMRILDEVYTDLGVNHPDEDSSTYQISTKTYAMFFRILYNATYLWTAHSQQALELLARTTYTDALIAGVPKGTVIAHKFGEHVVSADRKTPDGVELHDCGIVYHPKHHYLLCVMTRAKELSDATKTIRNISKETYDAVSGMW